jgi:hypothetical protein
VVGSWEMAWNGRDAVGPVHFWMSWAATVYRLGLGLCFRHHPACLGPRNADGPTDPTYVRHYQF